jgi:hypothetical protein
LQTGRDFLAEQLDKEFWHRSVFQRRLDVGLGEIVALE